MNKLLTWRERRGLTRSQFADRCGVATETVRRWETGGRVPDADYMAVIFAETSGEVGPADFYDLPSLGAAP